MILTPQRRPWRRLPIEGGSKFENATPRYLQGLEAEVGGELIGWVACSSGLRSGNEKDCWREATYLRRPRTTAWTMTWRRWTIRRNVIWRVNWVGARRNGRRDAVAAVAHALGDEL
ncbi:hypothetical protein C8R45DRAFT_927100 [Mycena sanguinolenta]|nr:hypothetical protein C8R45DRAFT_927100 [Mycena sanguinolenta]